jgi:hypothetical protein
MSDAALKRLYTYATTPGLASRDQIIYIQRAAAGLSPELTAQLTGTKRETIEAIARL